MSFVNMREYNKLKAKVGELEARIQSLEGYGAASAKAKSDPEPAPIPTIEEAVEEKSLYEYDLLEFKTADLLVDNGYADVSAVKEASDAQLQSIPGIGEATVKAIRKALE